MARQQAKTRGSRRSPPGRLRIVAGKWRSRLLPVADVPGLRPTSERTRETVFNWLANEVPGARCLDLFAGTGALGFEALSRGAGQVDFVENSAAAARALAESKAALDADQARILTLDAYEFLQGRAAPYDIIFLDPPYADESLAKLCRLLHGGGWTATNGVVYFEHPRHEAPVFPANWSIAREKTAGQVRYGLMRSAS